MSIAAAPILIALGLALVQTPPEITGLRAGGIDLAAAAWRTMAWTASIGTGAAILGWLPGRRLAAGGGASLRVAAILPLAIPGWLAFYGLWISVGPGTPIGDFFARQDGTALLREASLACGLLAVAWPIAAWSVAADR